MAGSVSRGADYLMRGARLLGNRQLRPFVIIPLLINTVIFASLLWLGVNAMSETLDRWIAAIPDWLSFLRWLVWPIVYIAMALVSGYLFTAIAILLASPFMGLLAEKTEELITGQPVAGPAGLAGALALFPRAIFRELRKFAYYLPLLLMVLLASIIPVINALAPMLWFLLGAWMMGVQYVDYPMDNHQRSFADVKTALRKRRMTSLGFGGLVALVSGVPILNFFVVPAAVCGATVFWCEEISPASSTPQRT